VSRPLVFGGARSGKRALVERLAQWLERAPNLGRWRVARGLRLGLPASERDWERIERALQEWTKR
jgi:hypothetical protein